MTVQRTVRHKRSILRVKSRTSSGVVKICRDSYSNASTSWFAIIKRVKERDCGRCVQCRSSILLDVHHILPLSRGGRTVMSNLITLCDVCHRQRHKHMRK
jgi:5-methylcytosine-specific restriction endonuclease McrA